MLVRVGLKLRRTLSYGATGKTTCLDVLAQRKNIGIVSGTLLLDGKPLALDFARNTAYGELDPGAHTFYLVLTFL